MKVLSAIKLAAIVVLLTCVAIAVHELGHFTTYTLFGYRARMSLQRVTPIGDVPAWIDHWSKFAGPAVSLVAAAILLFVARVRPGFVWATASFTNASLRFFPCAMDLMRALNSRPAFSDEGEVVLAFTNSPLGRGSLILLVMALSLVLTVLAAKEYRFQKYRFGKSILIYALSLAVGIGVVILDDLLGLGK